MWRGEEQQAEYEAEHARERKIQKTMLRIKKEVRKECHPQRYEPGGWGNRQRAKPDDWRAPGMSGPYDDIIQLPHPTSARHPRMSLSNRAAQFSPFAALSGHSAALAETARLTDQQIELSDDDKAELDQKQRILLEHINEHPEIMVTWFQPDEKKDGGQYITTTGRLKRFDESACMLLFERRIKHTDQPYHRAGKRIFRRSLLKQYVDVVSYLIESDKV